MTPAEKALWQCLRNRQLGGYKFRGQHPLDPFIADFYCAECRLVIELDGGIHLLRKVEDAQRTRQFEEFGFRVARFRNAEVETNTSLVLKSVLAACQSPSPRMGREVRGEGHG